MLADEPDGARLRALLALLFDKGNALTGIEFLETAVKNAVAVEINLVSRGGLDEAEFAERVEFRYRPRRRAVMLLHLSLHAADLVLQLPARAFESIVERESEVGIALVILRRVVDIDLAAVGQRQADIDLIKAPGAVMAAGRFLTEGAPAEVARNPAVIDAYLGGVA